MNVTESRSYTKAERDRFRANCARLRLSRLIQERFDRCCHGGIVRYRLPLGYRIACANGTAVA